MAPSSRNAQWYLNDLVINDYLKLCMEKYPDVYCFETFFYTTLVQFGYARVERWTKRVNIFSKRLLLIPVNVVQQNFCHWALLCVNVHKKTICYYDSLQRKGDASRCIKEISRYLCREHRTKLGTDLPLADWTYPIVNPPVQNNGMDCGVFVCTFSEYLCRGAEFNFDYTHIVSFRQLILYELTIKRLIDVNVPTAQITEFIRCIVGETPE